MAKIEGEIVISRPVDVVFDYVADQSHEPQYNPHMVRAEKITAGPVGKGTRVPLGCGVHGAHRRDADRVHRLRPAEATGVHHDDATGEPEASGSRTGRIGWAVSAPVQGARPDPGV